jgi:predicted alpha/beta superfamily hydrolase
MDSAQSTIAAAGRALPELIVISVGPPAGADFQFRRNWDFSPLPGTRETDFAFSGPGGKQFRDLLQEIDSERIAEGKQTQVLGGGQAFLSFLVDKVRPALARDYRMSDEHILWGHSGGGLFCVYAFVKRPNAFRHYICGSPNINASDYELFKIEERYAETHSDLAASLFLGVGEGEATQGGLVSAWGIVSSAARMAEVLKLRNYPSLRLQLRIFPHQTHQSVSLIVLDAGLKRVFHRPVKSVQPSGK